MTRFVFGFVHMIKIAYYSHSNLLEIITTLNGLSVVDKYITSTSSRIVCPVQIVCDCCVFMLRFYEFLALEIISNAWPCMARKKRTKYSAAMAIHYSHLYEHNQMPSHR